MSIGINSAALKFLRADLTGESITIIENANILFAELVEIASGLDIPDAKIREIYSIKSAEEQCQATHRLITERLEEHQRQSQTTYNFDEVVSYADFDDAVGLSEDSEKKSQNGAQLVDHKLESGQNFAATLQLPYSKSHFVSLEIFIESELGIPLNSERGQNILAEAYRLISNTLEEITWKDTRVGYSNEVIGIYNINGEATVYFDQLKIAKYLESYADRKPAQKDNNNFLVPTQTLARLGMNASNRYYIALRALIGDLWKDRDRILYQNDTVSIGLSEFLRSETREEILPHTSIIGVNARYPIITRESIQRKRDELFPAQRISADRLVKLKLLPLDKHGQVMIPAAVYVRKYCAVNPTVAKREKIAFEAYISAEFLANPDKIICEDPPLTLSEAVVFQSITGQAEQVLCISKSAEAYFRDNYLSYIREEPENWLAGAAVCREHGLNTIPIYNAASSELVEELWQQRESINVANGASPVDYVKWGKKAAGHAAEYYLHKRSLETDPPLITKEQIKERAKEIYLRGKEHLTLEEVVKLTKGLHWTVLYRDLRDLADFLKARIKDVNVDIPPNGNFMGYKVDSSSLPYLQQHYLSPLPKERETWLEGFSAATVAGVKTHYEWATLRARELWLKGPDHEEKLPNGESVRIGDVIGRHLNYSSVGISISPEVVSELLAERTIKAMITLSDKVATRLPPGREDWIRGAIGVLSALHMGNSNSPAANRLLSNLADKANSIMVRIGNGAERPLTDFIGYHSNGSSVTFYALDPILLDERCQPQLLSKEIIQAETQKMRAEKASGEQPVTLIRSKPLSNAIDSLIAGLENGKINYAGFLSRLLTITATKVETLAVDNNIHISSLMAMLDEEILPGDNIAERINSYFGIGREYREIVISALRSERQELEKRYPKKALASKELGSVDSETQLSAVVSKIFYRGSLLSVAELRSEQVMVGGSATSRLAHAISRQIFNCNPHVEELINNLAQVKRKEDRINFEGSVNDFVKSGSSGIVTLVEFIRKRHGISDDAALAKILNVDFKTLTRWLNGEREPREPEVRALARTNKFSEESEKNLLAAVLGRIDYGSVERIADDAKALYLVKDIAKLPGVKANIVLWRMQQDGLKPSEQIQPANVATYLYITLFERSGLTTALASRDRPRKIISDRQHPNIYTLGGRSITQPDVALADGAVFTTDGNLQRQIGFLLMEIAEPRTLEQKLADFKARDYTIAQFIRDARLEKFQSISAAASEAGVKTFTLEKIEKGARSKIPDDVKKIVCYTGVPEDHADHQLLVDSLVSKTVTLANFERRVKPSTKTEKLAGAALA